MELWEEKYENHYEQVSGNYSNVFILILFQGNVPFLYPI